MTPTNAPSTAPMSTANTEGPPETSIEIPQGSCFVVGSVQDAAAPIEPPMIAPKIAPMSIPRHLPLTVVPAMLSLMAESLSGTRRPEAGGYPPSVVLAAAHALEDRTDAAAGIRLVGLGVVGLPAGGGPRDEHVEIEVADELEALDVGRAIALPEHRGDPL